MIGIIGGSGLYELPGIQDLQAVTVETPFGATSDHGVGTDPAELMDTGHPGENDVVLNSHVTCQSGGIRENAVISHNRIVCNMGVG